jgi:PEP-CTERM motif
MKTLTYLTTGLCAMMLTFSSAYGVSKAVDWTAFGTASAPPFFIKTVGSKTLTVSHSGIGSTLIAPLTVNSAPSAPISNHSPFPMMTFDTGAAGGGYVATLIGPSLVLPGEYFFVGGLSTGVAYTLQFDGSLSNSSVLLTNHLVTGPFHPGILAITYSGDALGALAVTPGIGPNSGVAFFQNMGPTPITNIALTDPSNGASYIGVTTPEPSTYLAMAGGLGVLSLLALRRKAKKAKV